MNKDATTFNFEELRIDLSIESCKGYPMFISGIIFWLGMGIGDLLLPGKIMVWVYVFGMGLVLPLGILIAKVLSINFLATHNPLSSIGGLVGGVQIFFAPLVILVAYQQPEWMPFVVGILAGAHFLPYVGIYKSKAYLFQTIAAIAAVSAIGFGWMENAYFLIPIALVLVYGVTLIWLITETKVNKAQLAGQGNGAARSI